MSDREDETGDPEVQDTTAGTVWDAPNQQVVRDDASAPWEEGSGGTPEEPVDVDAMTKAELLEHARGLGLDVNDTMTKADIRAAVDEAEAPG